MSDFPSTLPSSIPTSVPSLGKHPVCYICDREDTSIINPDFVLDIFTGENYSCGSIEKAGLLGFIIPTICKTFTDTTHLQDSNCICGGNNRTTYLPFLALFPNNDDDDDNNTDESNDNDDDDNDNDATPIFIAAPIVIPRPQPPPTMIPSRLPIIYLSPSLSVFNDNKGEYPVCYICDNTTNTEQSIINPDSVPDTFVDGNTYFTCGQLEKAGLLGFILLILCNTFSMASHFGKYGCICGSNQMLLPSFLPLLSSSLSPSSSHNITLEELLSLTPSLSQF